MLEIDLTEVIKTICTPQSKTSEIEGVTGYYAYEMKLADDRLAWMPIGYLFGYSKSI